jgi:UDP-3-O-acyl-N-acetylglucosamine deacetylase
VPAQPFDVPCGDGGYRVEPAGHLVVSVVVEFNHPMIGRQSYEGAVDAGRFARELAPARTFGFLDEIQSLQGRGLIQGGSPDAAIVLTAKGLVRGALRWPNEFARHKALDLIGDLALLGRPLHAKISACRPSHTGNILLARTLLALAGD